MPPSQRNTSRQPASTSTTERPERITNWPSPMPAMAMLLATPAWAPKRRVSITPTGVIDTAPLPMAKTTPYSRKACQAAWVKAIRPMPAALIRQPPAKIQAGA